MTNFEGTQNTLNLDEARGKEGLCRMVLKAATMTMKTWEFHEANSGHEECSSFRRWCYSGNPFS